MERIFVAVGSNLPAGPGGSPLESCTRALALMADRGVDIRARSHWYRSAPVPESEQPDFINGVAMVETTNRPGALLAALHGIERDLGRRRGERNAARTIDLDLIAYGALCRSPDGGARQGTTDRLVLPHPRLHQRAFVLLPLREIAPGWRHPRTGLDVSAMIAALPPSQRCARLA